MRETETLIVLACPVCGSGQIRTTKKERICIRCGYHGSIDEHLPKH